MSAKAVQRRLAAILVADVVGYSRLMEADGREPCGAEDAAEGDLYPLVKVHGGRVVSSWVMACWWSLPVR